MGFFTGNTGAMWMASYVENGALNLADISVNFTATTKVTKYLAGSSWSAITVTGGGSGASATLKSEVITSTSANTLTAGTLTISAGGKNYSAGDLIKFASAGSTDPLTDSFKITSTTTAGIDSISELVAPANNIGKLKTWSLDISNDVLDTSVLGSPGKTFIAGPTTATGTATLMYYKEDSNTTNMSDISDLSKIIFNSAGATRVLMRLGIDSGKTNCFDLYAYITGASLASNYGEIVTVDVSFQMDGQFIKVPS